MSQPALEPGLLLRVSHVCKMLDISRRHVYRLIHRGELEAVRFSSRNIRVTRRSVDALIEYLCRERPASGEDAPAPGTDPASVAVHDVPAGSAAPVPAGPTPPVARSPSRRQAKPSYRVTPGPDLP